MGARVRSAASVGGSPLLTKVVDSMDWAVVEEEAATVVADA